MQNCIKKFKELWTKITLVSLGFQSDCKRCFQRTTHSVLWKSVHVLSSVQTGSNVFRVVQFFLLHSLSEMGALDETDMKAVYRQTVHRGVRFELGSVNPIL